MRTKQLKRAGFLSLVAASVFTGVMPGYLRAADSHPNVVIIVAENGDAAKPAPAHAGHSAAAELDKTGTTFTNAYSASSQPGPSNAGILTGRYPQRTGFDADADGNASPADRTRRGLDPSRQTLAQDLKTAGYATGVFGTWYLGSGDGFQPTQRGFDAAQSGTDPSNFIDKHATGPFFLYVPVTGTAGQVDEVVAQVTSKLRSTGIEEGTLLIYVNDRHQARWTVTERGIHASITFDWKGKIASGQVVDQPVSELDIAPTVLEAAGITNDPHGHLDGVSLLPVLEGRSGDVPGQVLYWRLGPQYAVREGDWKLEKTAASGRPQLFYLQDDKAEALDLFKQQGERAKELQALWDAWNANNQAPAWNDDRWTGKETTAVAALNAASGPWKSGDTLNSKNAPAIAGKALEISAEIEPAGTDGVIVTQGASGQGYAIFLSNGKLAFAVRESKNLTTITAEKPLGQGHFLVLANLASDGTLTLSVDGKQVAQGKAAGPIPQQPKAGFSVGSSGRSAVGDYETPNTFTGKITNVQVVAK